MHLQVCQVSNLSDFESYLQLVDGFKVVNLYYKMIGATLDEQTFDTLHYFVYRNDSEDVLIVMPFFLRKIPYQEQAQPYYDVISPYGYSGPLYNEDLSRGYLILFWEQVDAWYKTHHVVSEFMRFGLNHNHQFYSGTLVPALSNVRGQLLDFQALWENFKPKVRNNYRKSLGSGLRVQFYTQNQATECLEIFYSIYTTTMQRIGAERSYFYSLSYFSKILALAKDKALIVVVYKEARPISTELILIMGTTLYSFLGGTLADYFQYRPNDFLKIEVMSWAHQQGYEQYLLGGGRQDGDTLYQYKKSFFPDDPDVIYYTGRKIIDPEVYQRLDSLLNVPIVTDKDECTQPKASSNPHYFPAYRRYQNLE